MKEDRGPISPPGPEESTYLLARRAAMWANDHMLNAGYDIDGQFGEGYARQHPELVGAYMRVAASNFAACFLADKLSELRATFTDIASALKALGKEA